MQSYQIGPLTVEMPAGAAARWNAGRLTRNDMDRGRVLIPDTERGLPITRRITLRRATNEKLEPDISVILDEERASLDEGAP